MSNFSTTLASLSPEKRALLEARLRKKSAAFNSFPLSFAQQRLWLLYQLEPESAAYNIPAAVRLSGPLRPEVLQRSLDAMVQRHEVLRTTFATVNGNPVQLVAEAGRVALREVDLREHAAEEREAQARQRLIAEAQRPFDLEAGPLLRATLFRLAPQDYLLLLVMHHIVSDGWSINILIRELMALYHALGNGKPSPLPPLPIQYADFASWQRQWLKDEMLERQLAYWKQQLGSAPPVLELPTDRPRPLLQTNRGAHLSLELSPKIRPALAALSRSEGATPFMTLLAAFQTLLHRYTGQQDFCVGTPIANRTRAETEGLIGFFVNTLVLRANFSGDPTFRELLRRTREVALGAYAHQDLPFEMLVEHLRPQRDLSRTPLFQVMFSHQTTMALPATVIDGVRVTPVEFDNGLSTFDLTFSTSETPTALLAAVEYNTDLFEADTMQRLLGHYRRLLEGLLADPDTRPSRVPLLSAGERRQVLVEWNATHADLPAQNLIQLFEARAAATPGQIALVQGRQQLSYGELNARANQLAHHLRRQGVGPEVLVGISFERSPDLLVALLAILKAGGAYLPLDPNYPAERLAFMLADSQAALLLTQRAFASRLPVPDGLPLICMEEAAPLLVRESTANPANNVQPANLAYVIYTSGSTGRPKGVLVTHAGVLNHNLAVIKLFRLQPADRVLQFASINFDAAVEEIFPTWLAGATLVLREGEILPSSSELLELIAQHRLTVLDLPTAYWHEWVNELALSGAALPRSLRLVIAGGEKAAAEKLRRWYELAGEQVTWVNTYGPTETTIISTFYEPTAEEKKSGAWHEIPIGKPIANTQAYVLDSHLEPVPVGIGGELYLGGAGVARGYLNRPDLTAERFVPDPFSNQAGARLYRTGDLVRRLADGNLEFLGRVDHQIKLRGYRVELGEIEAVLAQHPAVRKVAVMVQNSAAGEPRLVAYCEPASDNGVLTAQALRDFLKAHLPEYLIPAAFVLQEEMPLTAGGKVDRQALLAIEGSRLEMGREYVAPANPQEELLAGLWQELLGLERVSRHDNFFELGGHSLLATQLVTRVRAAFGVELPLRTIFETPVLADLAQRLVQAQSHTPGLTQPPIQPISREGELPLSFAQQRLWFLDQLEPGSAVYNIPAAVALHGALCVPALEQSLNEIIRRHEILRTTIHTVAGRPRQVIAETLVLQLPVIDLSGLRPEERDQEVRRRMLAEAQQPFDLAGGPLLRATLLQLDEQQHVILLTLHHIVADGWSTNVFVQEIATLYPAFCEHRPSPLPPLPIQYADFAAWQRQWLSGEILEKQLSYWKQQLAGSPPLLELPADRPRPAVQTNRGDHYALTLPPELLQAIHRLCRQEGVTAFMMLLAVFKTLLHHYTGQQDICVGTPIANRQHAGVEKLIGFFVNTLVLRTDLSGDPSFRQLLGRVREVALGAYAHQDVPFEMLVEALQPQRDLSHTPLFQVMFMHQSAPRHAAVRLPSLELRPLPVENKLSTFDLTLITEETADGLLVAAEYNTDLFDTDTIARLLTHYRRVLEAVLARPILRLSQVPLLSEAEQKQILVDWNRTQADFPRQTLPELFAAQADRTPAALAVVQEDRRLTYGELNQRANQLAHFLRRLGVGPETRVGLSLERSPEMLIGLLGILKAGGAYVPLDPLYPKERLAFMCEDAQLRVLLTQSSLRGNLPTPAAQVISLDRDWPQIAMESADQPPVLAHPENTAYVIYTSGSTGRPKGVAVTHRSVVNHNFAVIEAFALQPSDRVLQFASINFDAAVEEIFPTWLAGATLVLRSADRLAAIPEFCQLIEQEQLTVVDLPTAYWHEWVAELAQANATVPACLRLVIVGGDKASAERLATWQRLAGNRVRWLNTYGPTEGTIIATIHEPDEAEKTRGEGGELAIGRPIANLRTYILNQYLRPVPVGVVGELCIGGEGVARGYLNRPDLTAEKFIPDPFSPQAGARLYKTGDRARFRRDGVIEFLGRGDHQVKIRGFRVELAEIEEVLRQHPAVRQVAVIAREDSANAKRLVAYCVPAAGGSQPAPEALRDFLKAHLPDYMIPAAFVVLEALPLTPSGKIDRKALPAPEQNREQWARAYVAPRTPVEETLAAIWQQVLGIKQVGIQDNFFELGGDSILSIQIIARARQAGLALTPKQLFQYPTIAGLAAVAGIAQATSAEQGLITGPVPLTPIQHWFFQQKLPAPHHWNQSLLLEVRQPLAPALLRQAVAILLRHHDALRLRFEATSEGWQQSNAGMPDDASLPFAVVNLTSVPVAEQAAAITAEAAARQASLNLTHGPLLQVVYFDRGESQPGRLLLVIHHLAVDGLSWRILLEDLQSAYQQLAAGQAVRLPPKTTSFQQWAQRLAGYAQSTELQKELPYWLTALSAEVAALPRDFVQGENDEASAEEIAVALSPAETAALLHELPQAQRTQINEILLTALLKTFGRWTGRRSMLVELEGHGREDIFPDVDLSRTVGWFTTTFPVHLTAGTAVSDAELLQTVKEKLRRVPNHGIGFGLLRYLAEAAVRERLAGLPQPEISFNYLGQIDQALPATGALAAAPENRGAERDPAGRRSHLLEITGIVRGGQLHLAWSYSRACHRPETISRLAQVYLEELRGLIAHGRSAETAYAPSDFPMAKLDQKSLENVLAQIKKGKK